MAGALVAILAGAAVIGTVQRRRAGGKWKEAGRAAGLRPDDDGTLPELRGSINGRPVTARYEKRRLGGGVEGGGQMVPFTSADAELSGPADDGVVVGIAGGEVDVGSGGERVDASMGTLDYDEMAETAPAVEGLVSAEMDDLVLVGTSRAAIEAVGEGMSGRAMTAIRDLNVVSIGDASGVVTRWAEARNEELEGSAFEHRVDNLAERVPGDATTVTVEAESSLLDGDELRRFGEGVVAIADDFEEATTRN
jgi:hypothetical protein